MKTDDLIHLLATGAQPVPRHALARRFAGAALAGAVLAGALMALLFGPRALTEDVIDPMFWGKLVFALAWAAGGWVLLLRLARPGRAVGRALGAVALPPLVLAALAAAVWVQAAPDQRLALLLGSTWRSCPFNIALLAVPALALGLWAMRGAAPTRPVAAGAGAGLLAGALGAAAYAFHCPETAAPFIAVWYVAGIALPTLAGAVLGRHLLRW